MFYQCDTILCKGQKNFPRKKQINSCTTGCTEDNRHSKTKFEWIYNNKRAVEVIKKTKTGKAPGLDG